MTTTSTSSPPSPPSAASRAWTYLRERFPLHRHGVLVSLIAGASIAFSAAVRQAEATPHLRVWLVASVVGVGFFFLLRVADEYKDADADRRHRPHRPVPRGLVTLRELGVAAAGVASLQIVLSVWIDSALAILLIVPGAYAALMTAEFFAPAWLRDRPGATLLSHAVITPLVVGHLSAFDWIPARAPVFPDLLWLLGTSFFGSLVFEIGRKLRAPSDEAAGIPTYSDAWGVPRAVAAWIAAVVGALGCTWGGAYAVGSWTLAAAIAGIGALVAVVTGVRFAVSPCPHRGRWIEPAGALCIAAQYVALGSLFFSA